jgi:hypothetical protein
MKKHLISLIVSGFVGVMFTSALVVAQAPAKPRATVPDQKPTYIKQETKVETRESPVGTTVIKTAPGQIKAMPAQKGVALGRAANLEQFAQQIIRQGRPSVRAELIFVRKVCALNIEQLRRINQDAETALKDAATKFAEAQQQPHLRNDVRAANRAIARNSYGTNALQQELALVMKKNLTPEQFARYEAEVEKRNANRRQSALHYLVDAMDRDMYLSDQQRDKLTESLSSHWDDSWCTSLEYMLYGNQFYPTGIDAYVIPILDDTQQRVWQGTQKVGAQGGFGGVMGNFMNDNDALEEELGEVKKIEPVQEGRVFLPAVAGQVPPIGVPVPRQERMIEFKKAVVKDAPKNR